MDMFAVTDDIAFRCSSNPKEYQMTELKLSTAAEVTKPGEKIVEEVKAPAAAAPPADEDTAKPIDVPKVAENTTTG